MKKKNNLMGALLNIIIWKRKTPSESKVRRSCNKICDLGVPFHINMVLPVHNSCFTESLFSSTQAKAGM